MTNLYGINRKQGKTNPVPGVVYVPVFAGTTAAWAAFTFALGVVTGLLAAWWF